MIVTSQIWRHCFVFRSCLCISHSKGQGGSSLSPPGYILSHPPICPYTSSYGACANIGRIGLFSGRFCRGSRGEHGRQPSQRLQDNCTSHTHTACTLLSETLGFGDCFHGHQGHDQRHPSLAHRYAGSVVTRCVRAGLAFLQERAFNQACH